MNKKINFLLKILLVLVVLILSFIILSKIIPLISLVIKILIPFFISFTISFLLQPIINFLMKKKLSRFISTLITLLSICLILIIFFSWCTPLIINQFKVFISNVPSYIESLDEVLKKISTKFSFLLGNYELSTDSIIEYFVERKTEIINNVIEYIKSLFSYVIPILITPVLIIYFTFYYDLIETKIKQYFLKKPTVYKILKEIKESLYNYFKAFFIIIFLLTICASLSFFFLGIDYFIIWGIIIGITDIIPYIGPYIGGAIVLIYVLTTTPNLFIYTLIIIICLQLIESSFLSPKIQSKISKINPIVIILAMTILGKIFGVIGLIISVPIVNILNIVSKNIIFVKKK